MALSSLLTQRVSLIRPGRTTNRVGDPILDYDNFTVTATKAFVEAVTGEEDQFLRTATTARFKVFFFSTIDVEASDIIEWDDLNLDPSAVVRPGPFSRAFSHAFKGSQTVVGSNVRSLEVWGPPRRRYRPSGLHHIEVSATEWIG